MNSGHLPPELVIRPASVDDVRRIAACIDRSFSIYKERIGKPPRPMLLDYKAVLEERQVFVAAKGSDLAGVLVLSAERDEFTLDIVAVEPALQGRGLGRCLIQYAEAQAERAGHKSIHLCTNAKMTENQSLYARLGYETYDRRIEDGYDRVFMQKSLA